MRNKKIWLTMCICGLFLVGCGNKQASKQSDGTMPEATQSETRQPGESQKDELPEVGEDKTQTESGTLSDAGDAQTGDDAYHAQATEPTSSADTNKTQMKGISSADTNKTKTGNVSSSSTGNKAKSGNTSSSSVNKGKTSSTSSKSKIKSGAASSSNKNKSGTSNSGNAAKSTKITKKEALAAALKHANVKESSLTSKRIKKEYEDGSAVYDVEFYVNNVEYDYEIRISDGKILKAKHENKSNVSGQGTNQSKGQITKSEAKKIALAKVPGAKKIRIKKDKENGKTIYEGEIHYGKKEYEFEIDASTGKILSWKVDND